jgi:hypothetical protein
MAVPKILQIVSGVKAVYNALLSSAGAGSANQIPALDATGRLDISFMPSGIGGSVSPTLTASAVITAGMLTNIYNNAGVASVRPADNTAVGSEANSWANAGIASGGTGTVTLAGIVAGSALAGLTAGVKYFLGTVGAVTTTAPATAGNVIQPVGVALSATTLEFMPDPAPVTYA